MTDLRLFKRHRGAFGTLVGRQLYPNCLRSGSILCKTLVDKSDDLVERLGLLTLLLRDAADETVHALDVLGAAKQRACRGRWFAEPFGRLRVLLERHEILVFGAQSV